MCMIFVFDLLAFMLLHVASFVNTLVLFGVTLQHNFFIHLIQTFGPKATHFSVFGLNSVQAREPALKSYTQPSVKMLIFSC
jgi:hypothetical protein